METLNQFFTVIDFSPVLIHAFPMIVNPISHGFQNLFVVLFTSLKNIIQLHPGLISGTFFMSLVYIIYTLSEKPKDDIVPIPEKRQNTLKSQRLIDIK
jgi:hypothetical protein